ncbi:hypothetical protein WJX84_008433 [Apatococcus fuscideae]|uniref:Uncharacterized protein n=1 Tax=Apatococcus fuscideae TaxID=2026836 RepID=A0AAW1SCC0_9CHLO
MAVYGLDDSDLDEFLESESSASESEGPALHLALRPKAAEPTQPLLTTVSLRGPASSKVSSLAQDACSITPANRDKRQSGWPIQLVDGAQWAVSASCHQGSSGSL